MEDSLKNIGKLMRTATINLKEQAQDFIDRTTPFEKLLREATANTNWGCSTTILAEIAQASFDYNDYYVIMRTIWDCLADKPSKWKRIFKTLTLLDYLCRNGSERVVEEARENRSLSRLRSLTDFHFAEQSADRGDGIRKKAKEILEMLNNKTLLAEERDKAKRNRGKFVGISATGERSGPGYTYNANFHTAAGGGPARHYDPYETNQVGHRVMSSSGGTTQHDWTRNEDRRASDERERAKRQRERQRDRTRRQQQPPRRTSSSDASSRDDNPKNVHHNDHSEESISLSSSYSSSSSSSSSTFSNRSQEPRQGRQTKPPRRRTDSSSSSSSDDEPSRPAGGQRGSKPQFQTTLLDVDDNPTGNINNSTGNINNSTTTNTTGNKQFVASHSGSASIDWGAFSAAPRRGPSTPSFPDGGHMPDFFAAPPSRSPPISEINTSHPPTTNPFASSTMQTPQTANSNFLVGMPQNLFDFNLTTQPTQSAIPAGAAGRMSGGTSIMTAGNINNTGSMNTGGAPQTSNSGAWQNTMSSAPVPYGGGAGGVSNNMSNMNNNMSNMNNNMSNMNNNMNNMNNNMSNSMGMGGNMNPMGSMSGGAYQQMNAGRGFGGSGVAVGWC